MSNYIHNVLLWLRGFTQLQTLRYKPGWNHWTFLPLYTLDYGTRVLTGGSCVSWSRWAYDHREGNRVAAFLDRLLNHVDDHHGEEAGGALWGTVECPPLMQLLLSTGWLVLVIWYGQ